MTERWKQIREECERATDPVLSHKAERVLDTACKRIAELEAGHKAAAITVGWHEQQWSRLTADLRTVGVTLLPNSQGDDDFPGQIVRAVAGRGETIKDLRDTNRQREDYWRARVAALEVEQRWVPVGDRLPPMDGDDSSETCSVDVLLHARLHTNKPWQRVGYWDRINGWHWDDDSPVHPDVRITHWQAITPPEVTDAK